MNLFSSRNRLVALFLAVACVAACPEPPAPVTLATLDWSGWQYPIEFTKDGRYWCGPRDGEGNYFWASEWRLKKGVVILSEASFNAAADGVPMQRGGHHEVRLAITRQDRVLSGTGWGHPIRMSR